MESKGGREPLSTSDKVGCLAYIQSQSGLAVVVLGVTFQRNSSQRHRSRTFGSQMHRWRLLDLDPCHENCLTLAVRTKYQRLSVPQPGR